MAGFAQLQLESWTRYIAAHLALVLLVLLLKLQGNVTAARMLADETAAAAAANGVNGNGYGNGHANGRSASSASRDGTASPAADAVVAADTTAFLTLVQQYCHSGIEHLVQDLLPIVKSVVGESEWWGEIERWQ